MVVHAEGVEGPVDTVGPVDAGAEVGVPVGAAGLAGDRALRVIADPNFSFDLFATFLFSDFGSKLQL